MELTQEQQDFKNEKLARGLAYEEIVRTKGYEHIKDMVRTNTESFMMSVMSGEFKTMEDLALKRGIVLGLNLIVNNVEEDIEALRNENTPTTT